MSDLKSTASSSSSALSWAANDGDYGEFEVARVLAKLGNSDRDGESVECNNNNNNNNNSNWGIKGKRSSKRVKIESAQSTDRPMPLDLGLGLSSSLPLPFDLNVDQTTLYEDPEECEDKFQNASMKFEDGCESIDPGPIKCAPHCGGRSSKNLTEVEKEARRIRRILANRESARQTIRRRQAQYEELTQKAANLASENENLKRRKETILSEFKSLQVTNQNLKEQMSQILGEPHREEMSPSDDIANTCNVFPTNWPVFIYNTSSSANPFVLPSCMQLPSQFNLNQPSRTSPSQEKGNAENTTGWCIFPCPWFLPLPNNVSKTGEDDHEASVDGENVPSPSSIIPHLINRSWVLPQNKKEEIQEIKQGISPNKGGPKEKSKSGKFARNNKKKGEVNVGAEARKRRRELMKLKSFHCPSFT